MKKKIFYWSPCLNPVGTVKSTLNSAISLNRYGLKKYDVFLINACGEWDDYSSQINGNGIYILNLGFKYFKFLPKRGYIQSRFSYILIFILSFFPLLKLIKRSKPEYIINHLITSLPLSLLLIFNLKTKFILRISGFPKLNFIRKYFWKFISYKLFCITTPSEDLKKALIDKKIFKIEKVFFLPDAIINIANFIKKKKQDISLKKEMLNKKIIISAGRLTKQKNFSYLIDEFSVFCKTKNDYILCILGDGEEAQILKKKIIDKKMTTKIFMIGYVNNVYKYFKHAELFILSSKWEEVGFVIVEAALSNLFVISSDCPNGPSEFLDQGNNGILFRNNKKGELQNALNNYVGLRNILKMKIKLKKNAKKYTMFRHFKVLEKIIDK